jgi:plasmid stabilization system protein ParE
LKLRFTRRAADDLSRLRAFIAKDNPQAARRLSWALRGSIQRLVDQSRMGQALRMPAGVRRWVAGPYVVHYIIEGQTLTVLRIRHGREQRPEPL